jgi:hypothetical protein
MKTMNKAEQQAVKRLAERWRRPYKEMRKASRMDTRIVNKAETVRSDPLQSGSDAATDEAN